MFVIIFIKHKVYSFKNFVDTLAGYDIEMNDFKVLDLKYILEDDLIYNPSLGTGQIQIKNINKVGRQVRSTWEFCQMLDKKYLNSSKKTFNVFLKEARKNKWIVE